MKKYFNLILLLPSLLVQQALGQAAPKFYMGSHVNAIPYPQGFITALPGPPPGVKGMFYLHETWERADILLDEDKIIVDVAIRIDIKHNYVEINHNQEIKVLPFDKIKSLSVKHLDGKEETFISGRDITVNGTNIDGLHQILVVGEYYLLSMTRVEELAPNYNAALDTGTRDVRLVQKKSYFVMKDNVAVEVVNNKKKLIRELRSSFKKDFTEETSNVKLTKESGMIDLVNALNTTSRNSS